MWHRRPRILMVKVMRVVVRMVMVATEMVVAVRWICRSDGGLRCDGDRGVDVQRCRGW